MTRIEIVTHVYAVHLPHYAGQLRYHLSSLLLHPPKCDVTITLHYCPEDEAAVRVIEWFRWNRDRELFDIGHVKEENPLNLGRRCIGRNYSALKTDADLVWFADGDFVFGEGCLDALAEMPWPEDASMVFPQNVLLHKDHAMGDRAADREPERMLIDVELGEFVVERYKIAIGGIQIMRGEDCRKWGYLNEGKPGWMKPAKWPFHDTLDDKAQRGYLKDRTGRGCVPIDLPQLYRLRQTVNARQKDPSK